MKYCAKCGAEMMDEAVFCVTCGYVVDEIAIFQGASQKSGIATAVKIFMILKMALLVPYTFCLFAFFAMLDLGILGFFGLIPLAWCLPMTIVYFNKTNRGEPIGIGFKVCSLLFVSMVAGILMLCDHNY